MVQYINNTILLCLKNGSYVFKSPVLEYDTGPKPKPKPNPNPLTRSHISLRTKSTNCTNFLRHSLLPKAKSMNINSKYQNKRKTKTKEDDRTKIVTASWQKESLEFNEKLQKMIEISTTTHFLWMGFLCMSVDLDI